MYEKMDPANDGLMNAFKWRLDDQSKIIGHAGMIKILENTVRKHPNTTFVACHLANCSYDLQIIGDLLEKYPNLYLDISARYAEVSAIPRHTKRFFEKYQDRLLYGTDMGTSVNMYQYTFRILESEDEHIYSNYNPYHWPLHGLGLNDDVLEKIYHLNAEKILKILSFMALTACGIQEPSPILGTWDQCLKEGARQTSRMVLSELIYRGK
jgi:predicted TIM-barrel fold metal-dependent hydrolase